MLRIEIIRIYSKWVTQHIIRALATILYMRDLAYERKRAAPHSRMPEKTRGEKSEKDGGHDAFQ